MRRHKNTNLKKPPKMIETIPYISENIKIIRELLEENKKYWNFILINSIDYTELEKEEKKEIKKIMIDEIYPYIRYKDISYTIYKKSHPQEKKNRMKDLDYI